MNRIITPKNMEEFNTVTKNARACVIDFYADWCGPCKRLGTVLDKWVNTDNLYKNVTIVKINTDNEEFASLVNAYNVTALPFVLFFKNGKLHKELVGFNEKKIAEYMKEIDTTSQLTIE